MFEQEQENVLWAAKESAAFHMGLSENPVGVIAAMNLDSTKHDSAAGGNASKRQRTSLGQGQASTTAVASALPIVAVPSTTAASGSAEGAGEGGDAVVAAVTTAETTDEQGPVGSIAAVSETATSTSMVETNNQPSAEDATTSAQGQGPGPGLGQEEALIDDELSYSSITGKHLSGHEDRTVYVTGIHACCTKAVFRAAVMEHLSAANAANAALAEQPVPVGASNPVVSARM